MESWYQYTWFSSYEFKKKIVLSYNIIKMSCIWEKRPFRIYEWSDTQLEFVLSEMQDWVETPLDLTEYDKVILTIKYSDWNIVDIEWEVDSEDISNVVFDLFSEATAWKSWEIRAEIRWIKDNKKVRLSDTMEWEILHSIKIPEWIVEE